jgi:hypothetical protein
MKLFMIVSIEYYFDFKYSQRLDSNQRVSQVYRLVFFQVRFCVNDLFSENIYVSFLNKYQLRIRTLLKCNIKNYIDYIDTKQNRSFVQIGIKILSSVRREQIKLNNFAYLSNTQKVLHHFLVGSRIHRVRVRNFGPDRFY